MIRTHYANFDEFNADVERAKNVYAADMAVQNDMCAVCKVNRRDIALTSRSRRCEKCKKARRKETRA